MSTLLPNQISKLLQFSYDPSNQNVQLECVKDTIRDMQDTFSEKNGLKFGMRRPNCV